MRNIYVFCEIPFIFLRSRYVVGITPDLYHSAKTLARA